MTVLEMVVVSTLICLAPRAFAFMDDFNGTQLDGSIWTFINPLSDSSIALNGGILEINVPGGVSHDIWITGNKAPRIMQAVANKDMEIEVKFNSELNFKYQMQGLLVEQDSGNFIRFDLYSTGTSVRIFAADFTNGTVTTRKDKTISKGAPYFLRIQRAGDNWVMSYGYDGATYSAAVTFNRPLVVTSIGLFAANHGSGTNVPAFMGLADYFYSDPGPALNNTYTLTVNISGSGTVTRNPDKPVYQSGDTVELTAVPAQSWTFAGWGGALGGTTNPQTLIINADTSVDAAFAPVQDTTPPSISNVRVTAGATSATVTWDTNEPAASAVNYGLTTSYEFGQIANSALVTSHTILLGDLTTETPYHCRIASTDAAGNEAYSDDIVFTTTQAPPMSSLYSDDFVGDQLDEGTWTITDPIGDSLISTNGSHLVIDVPGGISHAPPAFSDGSEANLVLHLRLDDAPQDGVEDSSGYDNNGSTTVAASPSHVQGILAQAYAFDGIDDHITVPDDDSLDVEAVTLSAWIYVNSYSDDQRIISKEFGTKQPYSIYTLLLSGTGERKLELRLGINGKRKTLTGASDIPLGKWTHVAATYDQSRAALYIDGRLDNSAAITGAIQANDQPVYIGASQFYQPRYFNGLIDDIRVYDNALSSDQIASLAALREPATASRENRAPHIAQSVQNTDFEIEAKFDSALAAANQVQGIFIKQDANNLICFDVYNDGSDIRAFSAIVTGGAILVQADSVIPAQPPYHLAVRRTADQWTLSSSQNRTQWTTIAEFQQVFAADSIGLYAGNHGTGSDAPAFTANIDYFYNTAPPNIENIQLSSLARSVAVSWQTTTPTTGRILYGKTANYEMGQVDDPILYTEHRVVLDNLAPATFYNFRILAKEQGGKQTDSTNITFQTNTVWADQFADPQLDTQVWTFLDPMEDTQFAVGGGKVSITVPEGVSHDFGTSLNPAPRLMQRIANADFEIEAKFDSQPALRYQMQGLLVEQDAGNFLRFDIYSNGSEVRILSAVLCNGNSTVVSDVPVAQPAPYHLLISRRGDSWKFYYSADSLYWLTVASFQKNCFVNAAGIFVANHGTALNIPAFTGIVDYFTNTLDPLSAPPTEPDVYTLTINVLGGGTVSVDPDLPTYEAGQTVQLTATPAQGWTFAGYSGDVQTTANPASITISADTSITALFTQNTTSSPINVWYGKTQYFGYIGKPQRWVNILGNLQDPGQFTSLTYSLNEKTSMPLTIGPTNPRLEDPGDFNVELAYTDLNVGVNQVLITATKTNGQKISETVTVNCAMGNVWPHDYSINWNNVTNIQNVAQVVDGKWALVPGGVRSVVEGYDRLIAIGDMTWTDYEITVPVTINQSYHDPAQTGTRPGIGLLLRWTGHVAWSSTEQPRTGWWPMGAIGFFRWGTGNTGAYFILGNEGTKLAANSSPGVPQNGVRYIYKMRVQTIPGQGGRYSFKVWIDGKPEPTQWLMTAQEKLTDPQNGSLLLLAHHVDATFGNVTITSLD